MRLAMPTSCTMPDDPHNCVHAKFQAEEEKKANASLIAAAPELYESLAAVVSWYERNKPLPYEENGIQMIMDYAKKALAKANGEEGKR